MYELEEEEERDNELQMSHLESDDEELPPIFIASHVVPLHEEELQIHVSPPLSPEDQLRENKAGEQPSLHRVFPSMALLMPRSVS